MREGEKIVAVVLQEEAGGGKDEGKVERRGRGRRIKKRRVREGEGVLVSPLNSPST